MIKQSDINIKSRCSCKSMNNLVGLSPSKTYPKVCEISKNRIAFSQIKL